MKEIAPKREASPLTISLFGPFEVRLNGLPLPRLRSRKGHQLLALLTLRHGREVERPWLAGILWPDSDESQALANLRMSLKDLRPALGEARECLRSPTPHTMTLDLAGAEVDVVAFDRAVGRGDPTSLEQAVALYRGPLLEGWTEEWLFQERQAREQAYLQALETLAAYALERGDAAPAERYLSRVVGADPYRESAQRALMQALAAQGNYAAVLQVYRGLRERLHHDLNAVTDPETTAVFEQIREAVKKDARRRPHVPLAHSTPGSVELFPDAKVVPGSVSIAAPLPPLLPPTGTVTFLFTDLEGSTRLWEAHRGAMRQALARHDALLHHAIASHGGSVFKTVGDQFCAVFPAAPEALAAAVAAQRSLHAEDWGEVGALRARMALHTGTAEQRDGDYFGPALNRVARLLSAGHGGQTLVSAVTYDLVRDHLPEGADLRNLGAHRLKDLQRPEQIFQVAVEDLPSRFPALKTLASRSNNLPLPATRFIGRESEIADLQQLLAASRLITLTGIGGCGKTRLALQVATELLEAYPDGVWLVEFAALSDPALVLQTVAAVLGVQEELGRLLTDTLCAYLLSRRMLLVLDNCEHLVEVCAALARTLLQTCPGVRLLVTSRAPLRVEGEQVYPVPFLALADPQRLPSVEELLQYEAIRLFLDRALLNQPGFAVTNENALAVSQVCQRLDGIPLAIELAAAWVKLLSVEQIQARLEDPFRLLTRSSPMALPQHRTLRATMEWSYELLSEAERAVLGRLSVFAGGFTLEAAEAICAGEGIQEQEVLELLVQLVDKSLVIAGEGEGKRRYRLLETVREYAAEKLEGTGREVFFRERHRDWFLDLAERAETALYGPEQPEWLERLEQEHDNLQAALSWSLKSQAAEAGLRLGGALWEFWSVRGYLKEGRERLAALLSLPEALEHTPGRAKALKGAAALAQDESDYETAQALYEESLGIWRELGNTLEIANLLNNLGLVAQQQGSFAAASSLLQQSLAIYRELGDKAGVAMALQNLGPVAQLQGDFEEARRYYQESLAIRREMEDTLAIANLLNNMGNMAIEQGDYEAAQSHLGECLKLSQELHCKSGVARSLGNLAIVAQRQGNWEQAISLHTESLKLFQELGSEREIAVCLEVLGEMAVAQEQFERAARLFGTAAALREALSDPRPPGDCPSYDVSVAAASTALGAEAFEAARAQGRAMALEDAITYAMEHGDGPSAPRE